MLKKNFDDLIGKTKKEIRFLMGDQFNDPHSHIWCFLIERGFLGRRKVLYLFFHDDKVEKVYATTKNFWQKDFIP